MASVLWKINRLRAMSFPEVFWRISQKRLQRIERKKFDRKRVAVSDHVFNKDLEKLSFDCDKLRINTNNHEFGLNSDIRLLAGADYASYKKKWNAGFQTPNEWPDTFAYDLEYRQRDDIGDARTNWELNRHFQFAILAKDYFASGDKKYLDEFIELFNDWNLSNPFLHGITWTSVMEVAIRCSNWCYTLAFLSYTDVPRELLCKLSNGILNMTEYITNHYSRYSSANNHLVVEAYAIGQSGLLYGKQDWIDFAIKTLTRELFLQNSSDGVNKEASLHYQSFYMEAMGLMMRLMGKNDIDIPETWISMLDKMSRFVTDCCGDYGETVVFGDDDEGKVLDLKGNWTNHYQYVLGMMSILLNKRYTDEYDCETLCWIFSEDDIVKTRNKEKYISPQYSCYKEGGYTLLRSIDRKVLIGIDHAPLGYGSIAAHGHADALSFQLYYEGHPVFVDPGTYIYHGDINSRNEFRKTSNHNTVCVENKDQSEMLGPFLWGKKANSMLESIEENKGCVVLEMSHDGYYPIIHKRVIEYDFDRTFVIHDKVSKPIESFAVINTLDDVAIHRLDSQIVVDGVVYELTMDSRDCAVSRVLYSSYYGVKSEHSRIQIEFVSELNCKINISGRNRT